MNSRDRFSRPVSERYAALRWELRRLLGRFTNRFGWAGWLIVSCLLLALLAGLLQARDQQALTRLARAQMTPQIRPPAPITPDTIGAQLQAFDAYLTPHDAIPVVIQDLLKLAANEKLSVARGEYRAQRDPPGNFLRYRMILPVKGDAQAIQRFLQTALRAHRTLALENLQFKRERIESTDIEARVQWVLLTKLGPTDGALPATASESESLK